MGQLVLQKNQNRIKMVTSKYLKQQVNKTEHKKMMMAKKSQKVVNNLKNQKVEITL